MKITNKFLKEKFAWTDGFRWVNEQGIVGLEHAEFIEYLIGHNHFDYANWLITKILDKDNLVKYAIFSAEQALDIYEKKYPKDDRPRKAIEAAYEYSKTHSKDAADAADAAADAAYAAAAYAAAASAASAAYADYADYAAAASAAYAAAYAAADAAYAAADAAYAAAYAAISGAKTKIVNHGIKLIGESPINN